MQPTTATAQPAPRRILAEHLQLALVARRAARHSPQGLAQFAAYTGCAPLFNDCTPQPKRIGAYEKRCASTPLVSPMWTGHIEKLALRTQREHGRREVLRIWGLGVRGLKAHPIALRVKAAQA